jgi:hypothetical protein
MVLVSEDYGSIRRQSLTHLEGGLTPPSKKNLLSTFPLQERFEAPPQSSTEGFSSTTKRLLCQAG